MPHPLADDLDHVLARTRGVWDEFRGGRLFLTGGTGFFGKWLLESFAWANVKLSLGARAVVLTRDAAAFRARAPHIAAYPCLDFHEGDVRSFAAPAGRFTHVIHAATPSAFNDEDPETMLVQAFQGTRRVLDFACEGGGAKVLFTGSGAVYGRQPPGVTHLPESFAGAPDHLDPRSAYGEGKRIAEHLCAIYHRRHGLNVKIARCFAFVGPYLPLDSQFAIGNFLRDGLRGGPVQVAGDGTPYRSYLYAADLVVWLWTILTRGEPCRPYNVGSDAGLTIAELAHKVAAHFGVEVQIARQAAPGAVAERYVPSTGRAGTELGLQAWIGLDEALRHTVRWYRADRGKASAA